jgi:hypothetical protein
VIRILGMVVPPLGRLTTMLISYLKLIVFRKMEPQNLFRKVYINTG